MAGAVGFRGLNRNLQSLEDGLGGGVVGEFGGFALLDSRRD